MLKIAIVDDSGKDRDNLKSNLVSLEKKLETSFFIDEYDSALKLLSHVEKSYDIVFFDVEMPGMSGMDAAKELRKLDKGVIIIFVTNFAQFAVDGYEVDALDYIIKPINPSVFYLKMKRAVSRTSRNFDEMIKVKTSDDIIRIERSSIRYVEVIGHYVTYHTFDGDFVEYNTLKNVEAKINSKNFVKCNRCYLVNLKEVNSIKNNSVIIGDERLDISRNQRQNFLNELALFMGGSF